MQLPQPDLVHAQLAAAFMRLGDQMLGPAVDVPHVGTTAGESGLGGDQKPVIGMQRLADQLFGNIRAIGIGGVDEIDAQLRKALQHAQGFRLIARRAPDARAGDLHGAEAQPVDRDLATDLECLDMTSLSYSARAAP